MLIRRPDDIRSSEITPYRVYMNRRHFIGRSAKAAAAAALVPGLLAACDEPQRMEARPAPGWLLLPPHTLIPSAVERPTPTPTKRLQSVATPRPS